VSLEPLPKAKSKAKVATKVAIYLGLGLGFTGELVGAAWVGWQVGSWWLKDGGSAQAPGLVAAGFVVLALCHVTWLLLRLSALEEKNQKEE
jgi:hypothetical protein